MALVKCNHCGKETKNDTKKCKWCNKELDKRLEVIENHFSKSNMKRNSNKEPVIKETVFIEDSKLKTDFSNKTNIIFLIIGILLTSCGVLGLFIGEDSNISSPSFFSSIYSIFLFFSLSLYFIWSSIYESGINEKLNFYVEKNNPVIAKWGKRFLSSLIDNFIISTVVVFYSISIDNPTISESKILFISVFLFVFYYLMLETIFQRTIGKMVLNLRVISMKSDKLSFSQILIRTFSRLIPIDAWYCVLAKEPIALHDVSSKTLVIDNS